MTVSNAQARNVLRLLLVIMAIDDQIDPGGSLEGADIASLAADDPSLHVVAGQVHDADGALGDIFPGIPLNGQCNNLL